MASLRPDRHYGLSCRKTIKRTRNKTLYHVKLTDTAIRALETYQNLKGSLPSQPTICFKGNQGFIKIPAPTAEAPETLRLFSFYLSSDSKDQPQASFECVHQFVSREGREQLEGQGSIQDKITVCATDDSYQMTRERMSQVEKDSWSRSAIEIKPTRPSKSGKFQKRLVPTACAAAAAAPPPDHGLPKHSPHSRRAPGAAGAPGTTGAPGVLTQRPLRERVIHLLALKPYSKPELLLWLDRERAPSRDKADLGPILEEVARLSAKDSSYLLRENFYRLVQIDWPGYSEEERQTLRRLLARKMHTQNHGQSRTSVPNPSFQKTSENHFQTPNTARNQTLKRPVPLDLPDSGAIKRQRLLDARLADTRLADPRLADPRLADPRLADPRLADTRLADPRLADPRLADSRLADPRLADPRLAYTRLADTKLADTRLADIKLADNWLADTKLADTRLADTKLADTRLADTKLADTRLADTKLADTRPADTKLADTRLTDPRLADTRLTDARLAEARLVSDVRLRPPPPVVTAATLSKTETHTTAAQSHAVATPHGLRLAHKRTLGSPLGPARPEAGTEGLAAQTGHEGGSPDDGTPQQHADNLHKNKKSRKHKDKEWERCQDKESGPWIETSPDHKQSLDKLHDPEMMNVEQSEEKPDYVLKYPSITGSEQRERYQTDFFAEYSEYMDLHTRIATITHMFVQLASKIKTLSPGTQQYKIMEEQIMDKYKKYMNKFPCYRQEKKHCEYLHEKLSHIKQLITDYDVTQTSSSS